MLQVSALPLTYGRQSYTESVGALPNLTYMSMSPVPPEVTNFRPVAPAGTTIVKLSEAPVEAARPVLATPFCSTVSGGGCVPLAASTMPLALAIPAPMVCDGVTGKGRAVL